MRQATARAEQAQVVLAPTDGEAARSVAVADIKRINPQAVTWHGTVGVNGLYGRSTTTAAQIGLNGEASRRGDIGRVTLSGSYSYGVQKIDGVVDTNVNNWTLQGKYDHFFSPNWYAYLGTFAAGDTVNFLRLRTTPSLGTGRQWIDRGSFHFSTEGGATYLYEDYRTQPEPTQDFALRLAYHADRAFQGGRINLAHNLEYLRSVGHPGDYLFSTDASVRVALTSRMFSELKGKLVYDNQPGFRAQNSTTELRLGVGLNY
jgi:hypothetical protein